METSHRRSFNYCKASGKYRNTDLRGTFLVDNNGRLQTKMGRGENREWIINYLFANPCAGVGECRRALLKWRGFKNCDESRGQYCSYFYDHYSHKWYHQKYWSKFKDKNGKIRAQLTTLGLSHVDVNFAAELEDWIKNGEERTRLWIDNPHDVQTMQGYKYADIFQ